MGLVALKFLFHIATAGRYGIFRDELYYLACAEHLDFGYVDQPPLIALVAWIARHVFGESLYGLRFIPAVAGATTVWLTAKLAREMGGGRFAQIFAALSVIAVPIYLIVHHWLTMNAFEPLIWLACAWCIVRAINRDDARYWIWFGVLAGLGLENKYTTAFFGGAIFIGLLATRARRFFFTRGLWIGAVLALLIFLPNLVWLVQHQFPFLQLMHNIRGTGRDIVRGPIAFVADQAMLMGPILFPLWLGGLVWLAFSGIEKQYRMLACAYLVMLIMFIVLRGKNYYIAGAYPMLLAAGAVGFEQITQSKGRWLRVAYVVLVVAATVTFAPTVAPILSPEAFVRYQRAIGFEAPKSENQRTGPLPQYFADEFGWEEMTREVARIYQSLPPETRASTAIFANGYGQAGAIDFFGPRHGLPKAVCNHQNYWYWGPRSYSGETAIVLGSDGVGDRKHFASVEAVGRASHPYSRRDEHFDIFLCRGLNQPLSEVWPAMKKWN